MIYCKGLPKEQSLGETCQIRGNLSQKDKAIPSQVRLRRKGVETRRQAPLS